MEDMDQSPLVSSSADSPPRPQPAFKYQFVREPEDEEEEEEEEEEDEDEDLEELEVLERKPAAGLSAAPVPPAPAAPPLDFVAPAPRGPLPAAPPVAPERQSSWDPSPASSTAPAPSLPSAAAVSPSKLREDDEPPARPPPPPPAGVSPQAEPAWTPPASAPAAPPSTPAAPKRRGSSGSVDETLFALPAASEPVIHSSADKIMDLKEQPGNTVSAGQEDFPSVLLETAASLPSLSPLSTASFKEHEYLGNLPAVSPTQGTLQETLNEASKEFSEKAKNPFIDKDLTEFSELEYSEMGSSFSGSPKAESAILVENSKEEIIVKSKDEEEDLISNVILHNQQESPISLSKLVKEEDKVMSPEKAKDSFNEMEVGVEAPMREEYADFKPFERAWEVKDTYKKDSDVLAGQGNIESNLEHKVDKKWFPDSLEQTNHEKDSESSNDDASFPSTPEAVKDSSRAYITCTPFDPKATESIATNIFPSLEDHTSENKTDEKKIEEKKAQIVTEKKMSTQTSNPFLVASQDSETDYVTTDNLLKVTEEVVANMTEGLTPDLVQEACESELNEATGTKLAYETKMDLVQTSEALQDSLYPVAQLCPSFEESEATPSPVLPDIVMEAPLNSVVPGASPSAVQPSSSPLEAPPLNYDSIKLEPENPPPYEEAMNVSGIKEDIKEPEHINAVVQETEASYISIACDLIKETKLSTEPSPDFSNYSEMVKVEKPLPDHSELVEDSSPDSEPVDLFSDDSIPEVPHKQEEAVMLMKENLTETSFESIKEQENKEKLSDFPPEGGKPYLESFQPSLGAKKDSLLPDEVSTLTRKEKIPLQMEELNTAVYSNDDLFISKEAKTRESETFSDSSPIEIIDEFPTFVSSKTISKLAREYTDLEVSQKSEVANVQDGAGSLPCTELPHDLSFKNIHTPKDEDKMQVSDKSDISKVSVLPPDVSGLTTEIGSIVEPKVFMKEAEEKLPSDTEKEDRSPSAIFSAELSKTSVVDLLYWRDIKKTGVVFGASLFLLLSLTVFSIVSVTAYIALALLSVTISFRIYKGVIQAIQKSDEGHPFRAYLESDVAISEELIQKYSNSALGHVNCTIKELRRLFLVDDLVDSLKFAVLMWVFTYVGALFNGLTLLILALISLFSVPVIYERHQAQIDHYLGLAYKNVKDAMAKIQAKIPGLKRKAE
ncbi:reticulon-4 isoform X2 [Ictidomys tridecemlineatus]|uniref:Reticulon n=1 Tax=Ictidomys tridecemlineatus TaxID=43179 RepID=I3LWP8_ICTTR|nr:reticulon-4 isoform X2 [Ictidomys tridecemlineatus]KAG3267313.1 reticulon 4, transcript variant X1 [Ictidomys tridecemlineatus]